MPAQLNAIREAIAVASDDLAECLLALRRELIKAQCASGLALLAKVDGNAHELALLRRRELSIISTGRDEPHQEATTDA